MDEWLTRVRDAVAEAAGVDPAELAIVGEDTDTLLELARIAAHESVRTNAPLLCYLVGLTQARGVQLDAIVDAVRRSSS